MSKFDEQIIVVSRELLFDNEKNAFNGFLSKNDVQGEEIFNTFKNYEVKRRGDMEEDPSYKQLISYCLLENENDEILVYQRLSGGGEERLHGQSSVGVGGHMNNVVGADSINEVLRVNEEVGLSEDRSQNMEYIGFINDDTNAVGKVHIGVVFKIKVKSSDVEVRETDTLKINWVSQDEINDLNHFESWSALILKDLK